VSDWYQRAVFYEVPVYAFSDSDGDGSGDFSGLTERLDYVEWLGVDCIWVLPFYPSPRRDGGYDVSDFTAVDPRYGTMDDVRAFLDAAHDRGLRVITDMIVNHTSDQHPWFQEARIPGSETAHRYVWSDTTERYADARVIFIDTHDSNWAWDDVAGRYYWHRFFDHQPDLNYDDPWVRAEMRNVVRFWLDLGFDGLRLDAVPYLYEREGTNGENLPETHEYLKSLRALVDEEYPNRMLLAEANQRPEDVVAYFGDGDELHMAYHFPLMPRLFMAVAQGNASAVIDILERTPPIPPGAQWGIFLRNHDELTLEMVSEDERAFMYEAYAPDPRMRKNLGIRRRLAPLLGDDRATIELLYGLLLSLPGSPFLYYGDEIGMGAEYLLQDRDGVRTPMQWKAGPAAGFSTADPGDLYLSLVSDPAHAPAAVNVAAQRADAGSLLHRVRSLLLRRRELPALGTGTYRNVPCDHPAALAFLTGRDEDAVLVVANFSTEPIDVRPEVVSRTYRDAAGSDAVWRGDGPLQLPRRGFVWLVPA